jgi:hypothetical protein
MQITGAIFLLTLRSLMRSRFLLCVTLPALGVVVLLPLTIQDDGTIGGRMQVLVRYTLGVVSFLLSVGTLGTAPGLVAGELESRRLQQVLVKPVRFGQIWLGKWLALVAVNAVVLGGSVILAHGLMRWSLRDSRLAAGQAVELNDKVSAARAVLTPVENPISPADIAAKMQSMIRSGALNPEVPESAARLTALQRIRFERNVVRPGGERRWLFPAVTSSQPGLPFILRVQFLSSANEEIRELEGEWTLGEQGREPVFRTRARLKSFLPQELVVPPMNPEPQGAIEVTFRNVESAAPASVLFHTERGVRLLVPAGSYAMNLFRATWLILFKLALLAAIGVTMGSLFYTPVAVLTGFFALVLFGFSGYIGWVAETGVFYVPHEHGEADHPGHARETPGLAVRLLDPPLKAAYRGINRVLAPLRELEPMERVAAGEQVPWSDVERGLVAMVGVGGGLMAALAIGVFRRRETG